MKHDDTIEGVLKIGRTVPQGICKAGVYIKYFLSGFQRDDDTIEIDEYDTKLDGMEPTDLGFAAMKALLDEVQEDVKRLFAGKDCN
jgi:hypothetical protein